VPEIRSGRVKFDGSVKSLGHGLRAANHLTGNAFLRAGMLENQARGERQALLQDQQGSIVINAYRGDVEGGGLALQREVNIGANAQEDTLAATPFVRGGAYARRRVHGFGGRR